MAWETSWPRTAASPLSSRVIGRMPVYTATLPPGRQGANPARALGRERDHDRPNLRGDGRGASRGIQVLEDQAADAVDDRLRPAPGVAPEHRACQAPRDRLVARGGATVAVAVHVKDDALPFGHRDRVEPDAAGARVPDLAGEPLEGEAAVLLGLDPRGADRIRALPLLKCSEGSGEDGAKQRDRDEELGKVHAGQRRRRGRPRQRPRFATAGGRRASPGPGPRRSRAPSSGAATARARPPGAPPAGGASATARPRRGPPAAP